MTSEAAAGGEVAQVGALDGAIDRVGARQTGLLSHLARSWVTAARELQAGQIAAAGVDARGRSRRGFATPRLLLGSQGLLGYSYGDVTEKAE